MIKKKIYKDKSKSFRLAVIGSGVSGLTSAMLLSKEHDVTLYESNNYLGGHALTVDALILQNKSKRRISFDVGFLVFNEKNYPLFCKLLRILKIKSFKSDMSFAVTNNNNKFEYGSTGILALTNNYKNIFKLKFWIMLKEIRRFYQLANKVLKLNDYQSANSIGMFLSKNSFHKTFIDEHFLPMCGAIWSIPFKKVLKMPLNSTLIFFNNHGLLSFFGKPKWKTISGGSKNYVNVMSKKINGRILMNERVKKVVRMKKSVIIYSKNSIEEYDKVVFATHADDTLKIIDNPTVNEKKFLSNFKYENNDICVHQDEALMPKNKKTWSSWNVITNEKSKNDKNICVTYWINKLQNIRSDKPILVTLNAKKENKPSAKSTLRKFVFRHPIFNYNNTGLVKKIKDMQGKNNSFFVGAWLGYGFHEDGVKSAVDIAKKFNINF